MARTILDYIGKDVAEKRGVDVRRFVELCYSIAEKSLKAFFELYELVENSSDKKLRREAHKRFSHAAVELAALLHELQDLGQGVR